MKRKRRQTRETIMRMVKKMFGRLSEWTWRKGVLNQGEFIYGPACRLLMNRFCQYWVRNIATGTTKLIMYHLVAKRTPGINQAIEEYWTERKCSGKMTPLQQMALDDGTF
jgi:hypothetical protein